MALPERTEPLMLKSSPLSVPLGTTAPDTDIVPEGEPIVPYCGVA